MTGPAGRPRPRPTYLHPTLLGTVAAGGSVGTLARALLFDAFPPPPNGWPWVTFGVNVAGAFLLGLLLHGLALRGPDAGRRRLARLGLGTGVLGGFTTYSTFALESATLSRDGHAMLAAWYDGASLLAGVLAAGAGYLLAAGLPRPPRGRRGDG